jgi:hypothetical protein
MGASSLGGNTAGSEGTAVGCAALLSNSTGVKNTAMGAFALNGNSVGQSNIALGWSAGRYQADGTTPLADPENSIYIGAGSRGFSNDDTNSIVIGDSAIGEGANTTVIGNISTTSTRLFGETKVGALSASGTVSAAGGVAANGPLVLTVSGGTANSAVPNVPSVIAGSGNDLVTTAAGNYPGRGLVMGTTNHLSSCSSLGTDYSAIIGTTNDLRGLNSIIVGSNNLINSTGSTLVSSSRNTAVFGSSNTLNPGTLASLVSGTSNILTGTSSLVAGQGNTVEGATVGSRASVSAAIGANNHVMTFNAWTIGSQNEVSGNFSLAFGCGLFGDSMGCTFVGEFNEPVEGNLTLREEQDPVFVVGNGTSSSNRSNALVVKRNGDVIISKPQGDISMGIYGD